jgi:hypothetical protein
MKTTKLIIGLFLTFTLFSCGKETPESLGKGIYEKYGEYLKEVSAKINSGEKSCVKIDEIGEKYKKELIEMGKKREALTPEDKLKCDQATRDAQMDMYLTATDEFKTFDKYLSTMDKTDYECYQRVADCFILAQYGNFDLLRTQAPNEAKKYGVEK